MPSLCRCHFVDRCASPSFPRQPPLRPALCAFSRHYLSRSFQSSPPLAKSCFTLSVGRIACGDAKEKRIGFNEGSGHWPEGTARASRSTGPSRRFASGLDISRDRLASIEYARTPLRYSTGWPPLRRLLKSIPDGYRRRRRNEARPGSAAFAPAGRISRQVIIQPHLRRRHCHPSRPRVARNPTRVARGKPEKAQVLLPNFDPTAHIIRSLTDLLSRETFRSPLERQQFALEVTGYARALALRMRRKTTRERACGGSDPRWRIAPKAEGFGRARLRQNKWGRKRPPGKLMKTKQRSRV